MTATLTSPTPRTRRKKEPAARATAIASSSAASSSTAKISLTDIGVTLRARARSKPGTAVDYRLGSGAVLTMRFDAPDKFFLRIARKGLSPLNDFAPQTETYLGGVKRLQRWRIEIDTFARDLKIPADALNLALQLCSSEANETTQTRGDGAEGLFYWFDLYWNETEKTQ